MDKDRNEVLGEVKLPLKQFTNQVKVDNYYPLTLNNEVTNGQIRLKIRMLWSNLRYFIDNKNKCEMHLARCKENMESLNRYKELYNKPFGILLSGEIEEIITNKLHEKDDDQTYFIENSKRRTISMISPKNKERGSLAVKFDSMISNTLSS